MANPKESNPGPMLAEVAGARTITLSTGMRQHLSRDALVISVYGIADLGCTLYGVDGSLRPLP